MKDLTENITKDLFGTDVANELFKEKSVDAGLRVHLEMEKSINNKKTKKMGTIKEDSGRKKSVVEGVVETNKVALIQAGKVAAGETVLNNAVKMVKNALPENVAAMVDTPLGKVVVANVVALLLKNYMPNEDKAEVIADTLVTGSYAILFKEFDLMNLTAQLTQGVKASTLKTLTSN